MLPTSVPSTRLTIKVHLVSDFSCVASSFRLIYVYSAGNCSEWGRRIARRQHKRLTNCGNQLVSASSRYTYYLLSPKQQENLPRPFICKLQQGKHRVPTRRSYQTQYSFHQVFEVVFFLSRKERRLWRAPVLVKPLRSTRQIQPLN